MYKYFKNIAEKSSCSLSGACSIHPTISALYEILLFEIREISFYIVKMKELGFTNKSAMAYLVEALSIFLINTSINQNKYLDLIHNLHALKKEIKQKYKGYCTEHNLPGELISSNLEINENTTITQLIKLAEINSANKQKVFDKTKQRLFELITIMAKLCSINVIKIKKFKAEFDEYDYEILRFFALTNGYSIRNEKIKRRICEFSSLAFKLKEKLFEALEERYGKKQSTIISTAEQKGHCILVAGDDFDELEIILKTIEKLSPKEPIGVYTNGALFMAHFYPYFQNNKFLKGHWGTSDAQYDFSMFPGAISVTKNFIQKIDSLYKGEIFSNKIISYSKVPDIKNNDYTPVIEAALNLCGFSQTKENISYNISYDSDKINETVLNFGGKEIVIVAGNMENENIIEEYKNKKIINLNCPPELELLARCVKILKEKNIKTTIFFPQCNLESMDTVFCLLGSQVEIYISNCSNILINPHVFEALKETFNVKII